MINAKGEWIYTNAEIAYELGISPATVNSCAKKLYGGVRIPHWNINQVRLICEYIKSISVEEDAKRLQLLHETIAEVGFYPNDEYDLKNRIQKDTNLMEYKKEQHNG